jgi:hypothetical protein
VNTGISLVRVWLGESEFHVRARNRPAERVGGWTVMSLFGPRIPRTVAVLHRLPVGVGKALFAGDRERRMTDEHLVADLGETDASWPAAADVIVVRNERRNSQRATVPRSPADLLDLLDRFPGCLVAAAARPGGACELATANGWQIWIFSPLSAVADGGRASHRTQADDEEDDVTTYASLLHTWLVSGRSPTLLHDAFLSGPHRHGAVRSTARVRAECPARLQGFPYVHRRVGG